MQKDASKTIGIMRRVISTRKIFPVLGVVFFLSAAAAIQAASFVMISDADLADQADVIAIARIMAVRGPQMGEEARTRYSADILRWLKNGTGANRIELSVLGGIRPDGSGLRVDAAPKLAPGLTTILFLKRRADGSYDILHLMLGVFYRVDAGGRSLALRDLDGTQEFSAGGIAVRNIPRSPRGFDEFADWLSRRNIDKGLPPDYLQEEVDEGEARTALRYVTLKASGDGNPIRWFDFDSGGHVDWYAHEDGQSEMTGGGFAEFQQAIDAWNAVASAEVDYRYAGTTTSLHEFDQQDSINAILWDDPLDSIAGTFSCGAGGTLAFGGTWYTGSTQSYSGESFHRSVEGAIVTQDGAGCFFAGNSGANGAEVFAHELGHTLGLGHSPESNAIMRSFAYGDGRGASLSSDEISAIQYLYSDGSTPPPPPPPAAEADLSVSLADSPDPVAPGANITYTATVQNNGPDDAENVELNVALSFKTSFVSASTGCLPSGLNVTCDLATVAAGFSKQVQVVAAVGESATGTAQGQANVTSSTADPVGSNNSTFQNTSILASGADLTVTVFDSPDPVSPSGTLNYSVQVHNNGPQDATGVSLTLQLPAQVSLVSSSPSCTPSGGSLICSLGSLTAGNGTTVDLETSVSPAAGGLISFSAQVAGDQNDGSASNNSDTETTTVVVLADLALSKSDGVDPAGVGQEVPYTLVVTNQGPSAASNVVVNDQLPAGFEVASTPQGCVVQGKNIQCALASVGPGETRVLEVVARALEEGHWVNTATVSASTSDPVSANNSDSETTDVVGDSDLDGVGDEVEDEAPNGGDGNGDGTPDSQQSNVASLPSFNGGFVTLAAPPGFGLTSVSALSPLSMESTVLGVDLPEGLIGFQVETAFGEAVSITLFQHAATSQSNSYWMYGPTADQGAPHWYEFLYDGQTGAEILSDRIVLHLVDGKRGDADLSANGTIVDPGGPAVDVRADLAVDGSAESSSVNSGQTVTYQASVSNQGRASAEGVRVRIPLPARTELMNAQSSQGACSQIDDVIECQVGTLPPGAEAAVSFELRLNQPGLTAAEITVVSDSPDPNEDDNAVSAQTSVAPSMLSPATLSGVSDLFADDFVGLAIYNPIEDGNPVQLEALDALGQTVEQAQQPPLANNQQIAFTTIQVFSDPSIDGIEVRGVDSPIQGFFLIGDNSTERLDGIGAALSESTELRFPIARSDENAESALFLFNPGPQGIVDAEITLHSPTGEVLAQAHRDFPKKGVLLSSIRQALGLTQDVPDGWISVSAATPLRGFLFIADHDTFVSIRGLTPEPVRRFVAPQFFVDANQGTSRLRLLNLGFQTARAKVTAVDSSGQTYTADFDIPGGQLVVKEVAALFGLTPDPGETISGFLTMDLSQGSLFSPQPANVVGAIEFGGQGYGSMLPLVSKGQKENVFLQVAQSAEFNYFTGFSILNDSGVLAHVTMRAFDAAGALSGQVSFDIPAGHRLVDLLNGANFFGSGFEQVGGHIEIVSDREVVTFALFGDLGLRFMSAIESQAPLN